MGNGETSIKPFLEIHAIFKFHALFLLCDVSSILVIVLLYFNRKQLKAHKSHFTCGPISAPLKVAEATVGVKVSTIFGHFANFLPFITAFVSSGNIQKL